jgi:hypothetical protein
MYVTSRYRLSRASSVIIGRRPHTVRYNVHRRTIDASEFFGKGEITIRSPNTRFRWTVPDASGEAEMTMRFVKVQSLTVQSERQNAVAGDEHCRAITSIS